MNSAAEPWPSISYAGFRLVTRFDQAQADDGSQRYVCQLTASELTESADALVFRRTLVVGEQQAALLNRAQAGTVPPLDRLQAELTQHGLRYMEALIDLVNRGFRAIAAAGSRDVSAARACVGMTDAALQIREG